jgi:hypothetical protein
MLPWYISASDVIRMCSAQVKPSVWLGVIGKVMVGVSVRREFGRLLVPYQFLRWVCKLCTVGGTSSDRPS